MLLGIEKSQKPLSDPVLFLLTCPCWAAVLFGSQTPSSCTMKVIVFTQTPPDITQRNYRCINTRAFTLSGL